MKEQKGAYTVEFSGRECFREIDYAASGIPVEEREYDDDRSLIRAYEYDGGGEIIAERIRLTDVTKDDIAAIVKAVLGEKLGTMPEASDRPAALSIVRKKVSAALCETRQKFYIKTGTLAIADVYGNIRMIASAAVRGNKKEYAGRIAKLADNITKTVSFEHARRKGRPDPALQEVFLEYRR